MALFLAVQDSSISNIVGSLEATNNQSHYNDYNDYNDYCDYND